MPSFLGGLDGPGLCGPVTGSGCGGEVPVAYELGVDTLADRPPDVANPAELLQGPDDPRRGVQLAPQDPVAGARRVRVVQVVPRLSHRRDGQPPDVGGLVPRQERPLSERVAYRVDRPGDVVEQAHADQGSPEESRQRTLP